MAYSRKQWENDITHLNADNFNNMEDGIQESLRRVQTTEDELTRITTNINEMDNRLTDADKQLRKDMNQQDDTLQDKINTVNQRVNDNYNSLDKKIDTVQDLATNSLEIHIKDKNNPHEVTAAQLNVYTKEQTYTKDEIKNEIALSGGGSGSVNVDTTLILPWDAGQYMIDIITMSDITPQNIFVEIVGKKGNKPKGTLLFGDGKVKSITEAGIYKLTLYENDINKKITYETESAIDDTSVTVSYLTEGGVEKLFNYIDIAELINLITWGTEDPNENTTSQFYFKYSE